MNTEAEFWTTLSTDPSLCTLCSLVLRFVRDQFDDYRESTIGGTQLICPAARVWLRLTILNKPSRVAAFLTQTVQVDEQTTVKYEIWCGFL